MRKITNANAASPDTMIDQSLTARALSGLMWAIARWPLRMLTTAVERQNAARLVAPRTARTIPTVLTAKWCADLTPVSRRAA